MHCIYCIPAGIHCEATECTAVAYDNHNRCDVPSYAMCDACEARELAAERRAFTFN